MAAWASALTILAGLAGASGVAAAAGAAHGLGGPDLGIAANFLLFHAGAVYAMARGRREGAAYLAAASLLVVGLLLFCGDLAARGLHAGPLFPMAAPTGGIVLILGWLSLAGAGVRDLARP